MKHVTPLDPFRTFCTADKPPSPPSGYAVHLLIRVQYLQPAFCFIVCFSFDPFAEVVWFLTDLITLQVSSGAEKAGRLE